MEKNKAIEIAGQYFPSYPSVDTLFVTTDEQVFFNGNDAQNHSRSLAKPKDEPVVVEVNRNDSSEPAEPAKPSFDVRLSEATQKKEAAEKVLEAKRTALEKAAASKKEAAQKAVDEAQAAYDAAAKVVDDLKADNK
jgi:hypothetical protein